MEQDGVRILREKGMIIAKLARRPPTESARKAAPRRRRHEWETQGSGLPARSAATGASDPAGVGANGPSSCLFFFFPSPLLFILLEIPCYPSLRSEASNHSAPITVVRWSRQDVFDPLAMSRHICLWAFLEQP
jgi:hypothetical protein